MYRDVTRIRSHVVKLRLSEEENALVEALTNITGQQKAVMIRAMVLRQAVTQLSGESTGTMPVAGVAYAGL